MKLPLFFAIAAALSICSCSSLPENTVTINQYKAWESAAPLKAREFSIAAHLEDEQGKVTPFRAVTAKTGKEEVTSATKEFIYPDRRDPRHAG